MELMTAGALVTAQTEADQLTPSPTGPLLYIHLGPGWECNQSTDRIWYMFLIPDEGTRQEVAPFIQVNGDMDYPELPATRGQNCNVHTQALQAKPNPYPHPNFTRKEEFFFQDHKSFTPLVN